MAPLLFLISLLALLISPSQAATTACSSQKFTNNKLYANCTDLTTLSSYLHWTYDASNSSLAVAFVAAPSKSGGWVSWGINPTGTKMLGSQALVAYLQDGTATVKTYNITSYSSVVPGKLSFDVWDTSADFSNGTLKIFATVKVPGKAETVNQVWQVGPGVNKTTGMIEPHEMVSANLAAFGPLSLGTGTTTNTTTGTTNTTTGGTTTNTTASGKSGASLRIGDGGHVGLFSISLLVLGTLIVF